MKQIFLLSILIFLGGCKASTKNEHPPLLDGNWVLKEYVENLKVSKSLKATNELSDFYCTEMVFGPTMDSVIVFQGQEAYSTLPILSTDAGYRITFRGATSSELLFDRADSTLFFADSLLNRVFRYEHVTQSDLDTTLDIPVAMPKIVNETLLEGNWSDDYGNTLSFGALGKVNNWEKYDFYMVFYNPSVITNESGDLLLLKGGSETEHLYGMTLDNEELVLYDLKPAADSSKYKHGTVKFRFRHESTQQ